MIGTVKFFNNPQGWGVVESESGSFFVHHRDIVDKRFFPQDGHKKYRTLKPGQQLTFQIKKTDEPMDAAIDVRIVDGKD